MSPSSSLPESLTGPKGSPVVYLLDTAGRLETRLIERWLRGHLGANPETIVIPSSRRNTEGDMDILADRITAGDDVFLIPLRVLWLPPEKKGRHAARWTDILKLGDPRDPLPIQAWWVRTTHPDRVKIIAAGGALESELEWDHHATGGVDSLASYVVRRAWKALDQAERRVRGNRYKVPRFVPEEILSRKDFLDKVDAVAAETRTSLHVARARAERYLREIAATHSPFVIDLTANAIQWLYRQGYGEIRYRPDEVQRIATTSAEHAVAFLPSHRSNLDRLALQFTLWENDLPTNHTAGGINMNFFPVGPVIRRTGVFFIRRTFRDNPLYKTVLKSYLDFLVEKRFPLEWYMEGGRSRSGKLRPAQVGLLSYVVDSVRRGKAEDIKLIPVSITYDHIQDIPDYAREARGAGKEAESLGWMVRGIRSLRRRYGNIHIRFGEPVSARSYIHDGANPDETTVDLQKLAFEVMHRIGRVTPVTPVSVVSIALLAAKGNAQGSAQLASACAELGRFIAKRSIPTTEPLELADPDRVTSVLDWLGEHGNVSSHEALGRRVFWLDEEQMVRLSYYRNVIVHFFVPRALAEIALNHLAGEGDPLAASSSLRTRLLQLRDLLKFEFYFAEKEDFVEMVTADIAVDVPEWDTLLRRDGPETVLDKMGTPVAFWALLPFLDAYQIVGDELESMAGSVTERSFMKACMDRARMYVIERRLISPESVNQVLIQSALGLARNRGLLERGEGPARERASFAAEIRDARRLAAAGLG